MFYGFDLLHPLARRAALGANAYLSVTQQKSPASAAATLLLLLSWTFVLDLSLLCFAGGSSPSPLKKTSWLRSLLVVWVRVVDIPVMNDCGLDRISSSCSDTIGSSCSLRLEKIPFILRWSLLRGSIRASGKRSIMQERMLRTAAGHNSSSGIHQ